MRILGHFFVYLRPHDNMFTGLGGFTGVILAFSAGDLSSSHRGDGVAPELTQYATKTPFSLITKSSSHLLMVFIR